MSSTSNAQDLLVNVFRPTYKWDSNTGFVPSLVVSNVTELIASRIQTSALVVSDTNNNTYIGDSAGINASNTLSNVGIGYSAMGGSLNSDCNVAIGTFALDGLANSDSNVAVGAGTDITGTGVRNILLGTNVTLAGGGSNNILIGVDLSRTAISNTLQIGSLLYGNLANGYIGINNPTPMSALDISGDVVFRNKVGIQKENPDYSLDVAGTLYVSSQVLTGGGLASAPTYSFDSYRTSGFYRPTDASYGVGAIGITVNTSPRVVVTSNKTYIYGNLDVCGTLSAAVTTGGGGGGGGTIATNGSASAPSFTFSNDLSTGLHWGGTSILAFDTSGRQRMTLSNGFLGIGTATPRVALDVSGDISANVYNGPGGTQAAPHYTFSDDRTTGVFFPGANMVGFTAGGTERMRISNSNIGIGTTTPSNALDVAGTLRVIGTSGGDLTFSNGAIAIGGSNVISSTGVLSNSSGTSNSIGGVVLETSNVLASSFESSPSTSNIIGGVTLRNSNAIVGGFLRNALTPTTWDISGGNISNSGTTTASNVRASGGAMATPSYSFTGATGSGVYRATDTSYGTGAVGMSIGGQARLVVSSNKTYIYGDLDVCGTFSAAAGGGGGGGGSGTVASNGTSNAPSFTFSNDTTTGLFLSAASNLGFSTGGSTAMVLSNGVLKINPSEAFNTDATRLDVDGNVNLRGSSGGGNLNLVGRISNGQFTSNSIGGVTLTDANISAPSFTLNGTTGEVTAGSFATSNSTSNSIGGVTINAGTISNNANTDNSIGGITLCNATVSCSNITTNQYTNSSISGVGFYDGGLGVTGQYALTNTGAFSNGTGTSNSIGGITLYNGTLSGVSGLEQTYYITSDDTLDFPSGYTRANVTLIGGGGGGGGASNTGSATYAGGGGGSGYIVDYLLTSTAPLTIVIGTGGAGGTAGSTGTPGNPTIISRPSYPDLYARGGGPGWGGNISALGGTRNGDGGVGAYGGGGGATSSGEGLGGIGKLDDGGGGVFITGVVCVGGPGGASSNANSINGSIGGAGGSGGGPEGGRGGGAFDGAGIGGPGCGGGGGGLTFGTPDQGGNGGNGYCIVRFLP